MKQRELEYGLSRSANTETAENMFLQSNRGASVFSRLTTIFVSLKLRFLIPVQLIKMSNDITEGKLEVKQQSQFKRISSFETVLLARSAQLAASCLPPTLVSYSRRRNAESVRGYILIVHQLRLS